MHHRGTVNLKATKDLATWVMVLLITQIALDVIQWLALLHRIDVLEQIRSGSGTVTPVQANAADGAVSAAAGIGSLVFVATVVLWCVWQHRAQQKAIVLAGGGLRFTPGWAVGWWFIPFANLVKPFQTVRELWEASHGARWREDPHVAAARLVVGRLARGERPRMVRIERVRRRDRLRGRQPDDDRQRDQPGPVGTALSGPGDRGGGARGRDRAIDRTAPADGDRLDGRPVPSRDPASRHPRPRSERGALGRYVSSGPSFASASYAAYL